MVSVKVILNTIRDTMQEIGYKECQEIFNFEFLPFSVLDNVYRLELTRTQKTGEMVGGKEKEISISIWTLNIIKEQKKRMDYYIDLVSDGAEFIESTLESKFPGQEFDVVGTESTDSKDDELVIRMDCRFKLEVRNGI